MAGYGSFSFLDHNGERSNMQFYTGNVTAASLPGLLTQWGTLRSAIDGITLGTISQEELSVFRTKISNALPSDANAQRERKWLVVYEDTTEFFDAPINAIPNEGYRKVFTFELPTAALVGNLQPNSDQADLTTPAMSAFVNAFEAVARSPYGGAVNVLKLVAVGRNL
jgi:phospholipase/lecithinase/hemolysin